MELLYLVILKLNEWRNVDKDKKGYNLLEVKDKAQIHRFIKSIESSRFIWKQNKRINSKKIPNSDTANTLVNYILAAHSIN